MKTASIPDVPRLAAVAEIQTCFYCADSESRLAIVTANCHRLIAEVDRLKRALQRESHSMDPSEPHRMRG